MWCAIGESRDAGIGKMGHHGLQSEGRVGRRGEREVDLTFHSLGTDRSDRMYGLAASF